MKQRNNLRVCTFSQSVIHQTVVEKIEMKEDRVVAITVVVDQAAGMVEEARAGDQHHQEVV